jgi:hypothetical protein
MTQPQPPNRRPYKYLGTWRHTGDQAIARSGPGRRPHGFVGRTRTGLFALVAFLVAALVLATPAFGYWTSIGSGIGSGSTGTLAAPTTVTVPTYSLQSVAVSWTASTGSPTPQGYYVTRTNGGAAVAACASSPTTLITGTSCSDTSVPDGTYTYSVTAKYRSWTAAAASGGTVTVLTPTKVVFTAQPTNAVAGVAIAPSVAVTVQTAGNTPVPLAGRSVTVALTTAGSATLSGTKTTTTNSSGVATFAGLSIDKAASYTLTATSSGLTDGVSGGFTISAAGSAAFAFTSGAVSGTATTSPTIGAITVQSRDVFGNAALAPTGGTLVNLASNSTGTSSFSATSGGSPTTTMTIPAGQSAVSFFYADNKAGSPVLTASGALTSATQTETITAGTAVKLGLSASTLSLTASSSANSGTLTVERQDTFGNGVATGSSTSVALTSTSGTGVFSPASPLSITGVATGTTFAYGDTKAGTWTVTASGGGYTSAILTATISPAALNKLVITSTALNGTASANPTLGAVTVHRRDLWDNEITAGSTVVSLGSSSTGSVVFAATSGGASISTITIGPGSSTGTFYYADTKSGSPVITVSSGAVSGTQPETINGGSPNNVVFGQQPTNASLNQAITPTVTVRVQDQFNNLATGASNVAITIENNGSNLGSGGLGGGASTAPVGGIATFPSLTITGLQVLFLGLTGPGHGYTLRATSGSLFVISQPFDIS